MPADSHITDNTRLAQLETEFNALSYAISHDLRAPVRAIAGFSQALQEHQAELSTDAQHFLTRIVESTQRLQTMIAALLELSRLSQAAVTLTAIDLQQLCGELTQEMHQRYPQHQPQFSVTGATNVVADRSLLRCALLALFDNAWKFTQGQAQPCITLSCNQRQSEQELCVSDNGTGFDVQFATRLGTPFQHFHPHNHFTGIGIGMALVQRVVSKHGGKFWADSQPQQGSRFYLQLPTPGN